MKVASCVENDLPRKLHVLLWECFCWLHGVVFVVSCADLPLFAQTRGPTETILVQVHCFWCCVKICSNTEVCNPVGVASVFSGLCSTNIGASIDIKQVSCSMACKVKVWRWLAVWQTISLGNRMFRYGSAFICCTALWSLFIVLIRHNCKRIC